ncbi:MAG: Sporulation domain protein, partial [bacterium]|nr:Sporulation domain protein [bacterium]
MRDLDRWKDKVEISLDGRQIFFLFFGSAVAACLIFVVGVLIGKRIEARALALQPAAIEDPLAALDQLGDADEVDEGLTFHKALTPVRAEKATVEPKKADRGDKADKADKPEKAPAEAKKVELKAPPAVSKPAVASAVADDKADDDDKSEARPVVEPKSVEAKSVEAKKVEPIRPLPSPPRPQALPAARPQVVQQSAAKKPDATAAHFTLQLSAFPDKADAEEFMRKIQSAGYKPFLVASEIPGKGVFYRVRVGDYG